MVFLSGYSLTPSVAAEGPSVEAGEAVATPAASMPQGEEPGLCAQAPLVTEAGIIGCTYCAQENCGCIAIEGCVLFYSCSCSSIDCKRTCQNKFCQA